MVNHKTALFVDCGPDIAPRLTTEHRAIVPGLEVHFGSSDTPEALIPLIRPYRAVLIYMAYLVRGGVRRLLGPAVGHIPRDRP
jgi:hypothetical protein